MPQTLLMCRPDYYRVRYTINPWMANQIGTVNPGKARDQWNNFYKTIRRLTQVRLIPPRPHVPDLVFTANAGILRGNQFILSRFRYNERRLEEPCFKSWFEANGYEIEELPEPLRFEGAGDALFQPGRDLLWAGYGYRTDLEAHEFLARAFKVKVLSLRLIDPRFYHLDTCLCPLLNDQVMYYPEAFDAVSRKLIEDHVLPENRIPVSREDAIQFACNAVLIGKSIILNHATKDLQSRLTDAGYTVFVRAVTEFLKAGGANKCLTIDLDRSPAIPAESIQ